MALSTAQRQRNKRARDLAYKEARGAVELVLKFEAYRGTMAAIERL